MNARVLAVWVLSVCVMGVALPGNEAEAQSVPCEINVAAALSDARGRPIRRADAAEVTFFADTEGGDALTCYRGVAPHLQDGVVTISIDTCQAPAEGTTCVGYEGIDSPPLGALIDDATAAGETLFFSMRAEAPRGIRETATRTELSSVPWALLSGRALSADEAGFAAEAGRASVAGEADSVGGLGADELATDVELDALAGSFSVYEATESTPGSSLQRTFDGGSFGVATVQCGAGSVLLSGGCSLCRSGEDTCNTPGEASTLDAGVAPDVHLLVAAPIGDRVYRCVAYNSSSVRVSLAARATCLSLP